MRSTKLLMADHEIILDALHVLVAINTDLEDEKYVDSDDVRSLLSFFREFVDGYHHVKEEAILFPALIQASMPQDAGPLRVITYEHERGRALTAAMQNAINAARIDDFLMYATRYVDLLTEHIEKENWVLFDKAEQILNDDEDESVAAAFEHFERLIVGRTALDNLHRTIEKLRTKYLGGALRRTVHQLL